MTQRTTLTRKALSTHTASMTTPASPRPRLPHLAHLSRMTFLSGDGSDTDDSDAPEGRHAAFHNGVCYGSVEKRKGMHLLLGLPGGLGLDTQVVAHGCSSAPPQDTEVMVEVGNKGRPISALDVENALQSIPIDCFPSGRSYWWEGVRVARDGKKAYILWGS